jgi:hypothetical protein
MPIIATTNTQQRELIPAGNYIGICYQMIEIGMVKKNIMGTEKVLHKVRIGWELPTELKVFNEEKGEQPCVISKEFTLSMHEKSALRAVLKSWRGKDFTDEESKAFDITKILGKPCMINIIHKPGKADPTKTYQEISSITGVPKGMPVPAQINKTIELSYDRFDENIFESLPDFIKNKMKESLEYAAMKQPELVQMNGNAANAAPEAIDDLPF